MSRRQARLPSGTLTHRTKPKTVFMFVVTSCVARKKLPYKSNLRKEGFIWVHSVKVHSRRGVRGQKLEAALPLYKLNPGDRCESNCSCVYVLSSIQFTTIACKMVLPSSQWLFPPQLPNLDDPSRLPRALTTLHNSSQACPESNLIQIIPHRPVQRFVSWVILNLVRLTI